MKTKKHCSLEADVRWTPDAKENIETWNQWCSRDRNLRYRDLVKTARPRLHQKSRDSRLEIRDVDSILQILCSLPNFLKMSSSLLSWILLKFLAFFRPVLVVFNLQIQQKKSLNYKNFTIPFLCNIQSLETWNLRDRDRNSQKWVSRLVSRPRPSLKESITACNWFRH